MTRILRIPVPCNALNQPDWSLEVYGVVDSTHKECCRRIAGSATAPPVHNSVVIAAKQTEGIGTGGRKWASNFFGGVLLNAIVDLSVLKRGLALRIAGDESFVNKLGLLDRGSQTWRPLISATLNAAGTVAAARTARGFAMPAAVKWPNDIHYRDRKLGGVIAHIDANGDWATIGIGLNIRQNEAKLVAGVRDQQVATIRAVRHEMALDGRVTVRQTIGTMLMHLGSALYGVELANLYAEYCCYLDTLGREVDVLDKASGHHVFRGKAESFTPDWQLSIAGSSGTFKAIAGQHSIRYGV